MQKTTQTCKPMSTLKSLYAFLFTPRFYLNVRAIDHTRNEYLAELQELKQAYEARFAIPGWDKRYLQECEQEAIAELRQQYLPEFREEFSNLLSGSVSI